MNEGKKWPPSHRDGQIIFHMVFSGGALMICATCVADPVGAVIFMGSEGKP